MEIKRYQVSGVAERMRQEKSGGKEKRGRERERYRKEERKGHIPHPLGWFWWT